MAGRESIRRLVLVLTSQCNLRCGYCYQNDKKDGVMTWDTLRESIDFGLDTERDEIEFDFFGGEPLLQFPLIRKAIRYVEKQKRERPRVYYGIATNGTLVDRKVFEFLIENDFRTQLSFDGVPAAQDLRGADTFDALDDLLDRLRDRHPDYLENLSIVSTVTPKTVPYLAESAAYFLDKGVPRVSFSPTITHTPHWREEDIELLDVQFAELLESAVRHFEVTGETPITDLCGGTPDAERGAALRERGSECGSGISEMCGVMRGETPAVDMNGEVHGCVMFAGATQKWRTSFLREQIDSMAFGDIRSPELDENFAAFPARAEATGLFDGKENKYSSYGSCRDCRYRSSCSICPVSIGNIPGNDDPDRIPDFPCAYNLVSIKYRNLFAARTEPEPAAESTPSPSSLSLSFHTPSAGSRRIMSLAQRLRS